VFAHAVVPNAAMTTLLEVRDLTKVFALAPGVDLVAVRNASLTVGRGETLGLVGESGSGKTTLGRCILRLIEPTNGTVVLNGNNITKLMGNELRYLRSHMQLVFQDPFASLNPRLTVSQTVQEPLMLHRFKRSERQRRTAEILRQVGLDESTFDCYPLDLTASEQQRVGIARALVTRPELVVLDEPTSMLDPSARADLLALLKQIQSETGTAYVFISHDLTSVARISHRIAIMYLGHIVEQAPTDMIMAHQYHPYSRALLSAVLLADPRRVPSPHVIEGEIPNAVNPRRECPLFSRCPIREDACHEAIPPMLEIKPRHFSACRRWNYVHAA
jgi:oligopeptide/dipeptide ABC transporter ATP-binding protein